MYALRLCKSLLVGSIAFFFALVAFNNITDYGSNLLFVQHVLSMDDTFKGNAAMWRALPYPAMQHLFYISIIIWETLCMVLNGCAAALLLRASRATTAEFNHAKRLATIGITASLLLWSVAFLSIGGEWFLMWQSQTWNGQSSAFRMFTLHALILLFLWQREDVEF
jgi:predicted small integral membrane protein